MKKKLLLAGGSYSDIPLILEAKKNGFYVITSGNRKVDLGHCFSDEYHFVDYANKNNLLTLAKKLKVDFIVPSCHDLSLTSCAFVAEKLNLPGYDSYETTLLLHHKNKFRVMCKELGIPSPFSTSFSDKVLAKNYLLDVKLPRIVKPIDLGGGRGITVVRKKKDINKAIDYAFDCSKSKTIVIEEFIEGTLHSFSTIIVDKKIKFYFADDEFSYVNPFGVATSSSPSSDFKLIKEKLFQVVEKIAKKLKLSNGLLHTQYILDKRKNLYIVEMTRRMPGDWYSFPVKLSTGVNYAYWVLQGFLNGDFSELKLQNQKGFYSRHCIMANKKGIINNLYIDDSIKNNIIMSFIWFNKGLAVKDFVFQKFGLVFLKFHSKEEMNEKTLNINQLIRLQVN